ncbi:MAG: hypothetical protein C0518_02020 [Opitutus sp.]|nr:hypothetical protein [Opitutus sp.]
MPDPAPSSGSSGSSLPQEIIQSIAISNAKSIGEQPAILANLALANQILNTNLQQQVMISNQQAMNQIAMATMSRCVSLVAGDAGGDPHTSQAILSLIDVLKHMQPGGGNSGGGGGGKTPVHAAAPHLAASADAPPPVIDSSK